MYSCCCLHNFAQHRLLIRDLYVLCLLSFIYKVEKKFCFVSGKNVFCLGKKSNGRKVNATKHEGDDDNNNYSHHYSKHRLYAELQRLQFLILSLKYVFRNDFNSWGSVSGWRFHMQQMLVCHSLLLCSRAEIPFMHHTHIVYTVFVLHQHKGAVFARWGRDDLLSMSYNEIIFSDKQLRAFWADWKAAERGGYHGAHFRGCVLCLCTQRN